MLLFIATPATAFQFDWGSADVNWTNGNLGPQVFTDVDGSGITVTVEITGDVSNMVGNSPSLLNVGGDLDLRVFPDFADKTESATITLTFSQPVTIDNFIIKDLDGSTGAWSDGVIVTAVQDTSFDGSPNDISAGSLITILDSNQFEPLTSGSVPYTDPRGWLTTSFNQRQVQSISIIQYPGQVAGADPEPGAITLSEFAFYTDLPLEVTKTADTAGPLNPGDTINYTISLTNNRTTNEDGVEISDALPAGMTYQSGSTLVTGFVAQPSAADDFASGDFTGGSGWTGNWTVLNPSGSPLIQVVGGRARLAGVSGPDPYLTRTVAQDLSGASAVLLNFNLDTSGNLDNDGDTDQFGVYVSSNGGASWNQVASYSDDVSGPQSIDITAFASAQTAIRFGVDAWVFPANGNNAAQYYYVDDVSILPTFPSPPAVTLDNALGGFPDLDDGTPPNLVTLADGFYLPAGQTMTASFAATVDMPSAMGALNVAVANTANYSDAREAISEVPVVSSCAINPETVTIKAQADDGYWQTLFGVPIPYFYRNYIRMGDSDTEGALRFRGITIPNGALVSAAVLDLTGFASDSSGTAQVDIAARDTANAPAFGPLPPAGLTSASVSWNLGAVTAGNSVQSPDLTAVIQELVDSYGGLDSAAVALLLQGTGDTNRQLNAYGGAFDPDNASLSITWQCPDVDYGDAPVSYGEAGHILPAVPVIYLGAGDAPDFESGQLYSAAADGDDADNSDDENGVVFRSPGGTNQSIFADVDVVSSGAATVCGWLDRPDGVVGGFEAADGQCTAVGGSGTVTFQWANLPTDIQYATFARFRVSSAGLTPGDATGRAIDGEVEDYPVQFNFTPTSAVIDNFRVELVRVAELLADDAAGGNDPAGSPGDSSGESLNDESRNDNGNESLYAALAGLAPDAQVAVVQWETLQERGTQGFYVERRGRGENRWTRLNAAQMLPGLIVSPLGGEYLLLDTAAQPGERYRYRLVEQEIWGSSRTYGPWSVVIGETAPARSTGKTSKRKRTSRAAAKSRDERKKWGAWRKLKQHYAARPRLADAPPRKASSADKAARKALRRAARDNSALRLRNTDAGLHRLDLATMSELSGIAQNRVRRQLSRGKWTLSVAGESRSWHYSDRDDAFYYIGESRRTRESLENAYQLRRGKGAPMTLIEGDGPAAVDPTSFRETLAFEENPFLLAHLHSEEDADYGYWDYINTNGRPSASLTLPVPDPSPEGSAGELRITLRGVLDPVSGDDQRATAQLNGIPLDGQVSWDGNNQAQLVVPFSASELLAGPVADGLTQAILTITGEAINGASDAVFMIDRIELSYDRSAVARDNRLWLRDMTAGNYTVGGFTSPDIHLVDSSTPNQMSWREDTTIEQTNAGDWQISFRGEGGDYLLSTSPYEPAAQQDLPSSLASRNNGANYLVIAPRELAAGAQALAEYRRGRFGSVRIAWLQDIYDEFSDGRTDSAAIQAFLQRVHRRWQEVPEYVALLGRGTLDHPDALGQGDSLLPLRLAATPWGLAPSDNRYADIDGDHVPDFLLGRISVSSNEALEAYLDKLSAYEAAPAGGWTQWTAVVADDPDEGGEFRNNADQAGALLAASGFGVESLYHPDVDVGENLVGGLQAGAWALVNYSGHGARTSLGRPSEGFISSLDVAGMNNAPRLPLFAALTCGALDSSYPGQLSLGDALANQPAGGSIASFGATGLSLDSYAHALNLAWLNALLEGASLTDAARQARQQGYDAGLPSYMLDIYSVAGDPAVELKHGE